MQQKSVHVISKPTIMSCHVKASDHVSLFVIAHFIAKTTPTIAKVINDIKTTLT